MSAHPFAAVCAALESLAPLRHAAEWDNVGLLVAPLEAAPIERVHLCIDLTEAVYEEALDPAQPAQLIVAYHPPIFSGLKRLDPAHSLTRTLMRAVRDQIAIYSPHTALDAVQGGVNDWLIGSVGVSRLAQPIEASPAGTPGVGYGRIGPLDEPAPLPVLVGRLKQALQLPAVRVARATAHTDHQPIERVAVCPGAGGSVLLAAREAELLITGEMRHHDVLACVARGQSVILTDHTHCERGYLPHFARMLSASLPGLNLTISSADEDPLKLA